ncbi:uncharacterized protein [Montipora capricornis]|uniref:uncharacterized protein n=1 Tax=Montipora capricornis TaxID=246305 RepID=UPI0035F204F4
MTPKTCPLVTLNLEALGGISQDYWVASRLVFIPFVTGPTSPDGLPAQQRAEEELSRHLKEAPRAMGTMLSLKLETILEAAKGLKTKIASLYPETDDRICENYGILLAMAEEVARCLDGL